MERTSPRPSIEYVSSSNNRYLYGMADEHYIRDAQPPTMEVFKPGSSLRSYKFCVPDFLKKSSYYDKNDLPITFKVSPECLYHLASNVVNSIPSPEVYKWTINDVCKWISRYGYPQYMHTFRTNFVNGRRLLLCDASALAAMNIKRFDHIQHIARGIRGLFSFNMTKFERSISLPPEYHYELYKLFRTKSGPRYERTTRTELWESYQLLHKNKHEYDDHWQKLERWLNMEKDPEFPVLIGGARRFNLYKCTNQPTEAEVIPNAFKPCRCMPPCECRWTERDLRQQWRISSLPTTEHIITRNESILSVLQDEYPFRYGTVLTHEVP